VACGKLDPRVSCITGTATTLTEPPTDEKLMLTKLLQLAFLSNSVLGAVHYMGGPLSPSECEVLCDVRLIDDLTGGPAITYDFSQAVNGICACSTPDEEAQNITSWCDEREDCSGTIIVSFNSGPNIRLGGTIGIASYCADGLSVLSARHGPEDGAGPAYLRGCGDSIKSAVFEWYQDNSPAAGVDCDVFLGSDTFTVGCGVCNGECVI
jgi:hypothetical protein